MSQSNSFRLSKHQCLSLGNLYAQLAAKFIEAQYKVRTYIAKTHFGKTSKSRFFLGFDNIIKLCKFCSFALPSVSESFRDCSNAKRFLFIKQTLHETVTSTGRILGN